MTTRAPAVSGSFYPAPAAQLRADVRAFLGDAGPTRRAVAVVAPHAGYVYSGATAGVAFAAVDVPATCLILAPNHTGRARAPSAGSLLRSIDYRTPLGDVPVDHALADALVREADGLLEDDPLAHAGEHAVEVLLPFLQERNPAVCIVPVVLGWGDWPRAARLAAAIVAAMGDRGDVLVVASSDMNHYESAEATRDKDAAALDRLVALDGAGLLRLTSERHITMCGRVPAACACEVARLRGGSRGEVLAWAHSGLVNGDDRRVVGYAAVLLGVA